MSNKTITIQQGTGDDALEMTVQVTQEELDKMEEIRSKDPSAWEGRGLDLVKAAKDAIIEASKENAHPKRCTNWKLILGIALGVLAIIGTIIFAEKSRDKEPEVSQQQPNEYIHNLWLLSSRNGYKRDENYFKDELIKSVEYRKLFYDKLKAEEPNFIEKYSDFEKHWLYDVLSKPVYGLNLGTSKEFDSLVTNNEESRKWLWDKANEYGLNVGSDYDEFWSLIAPESYYYDHLCKLYNDATSRGFTEDFNTFHEFLTSSKENRHRFFEKMKGLGMKATERDYLQYIGYEEDLLIEIDWQSVLNDFMATKEAKPNLTDEEWFEKFPEFNNDEKLLQAAFDYDATVKSGKYSDENELKSKFPEFWPDYLTNTRTNQNVDELYKGLCDNNLYNGSIEDFKNSLKCEPYRDALYRYLFEKKIYEGTYDGFHKEIGMSITTNSITANHRRVLYDILSLYNYDLGDYETFSQKMNDEKKRRTFYDAVSEEYDIGSWKEFSDKVVDSPKNSDFSLISSQLTTFSSKQYDFTYQYDDNTLKLVEKTNKNSHCVMKLQSPVDEVKSTLVSVWENPDFSSSYDTDFVSSCQSVDEGMGKVISSAVKTKVDGVNALKSELIISPMGKSYYAAIYRIIHKKRMYMLNIYIPMEEYNKDKSYGDKCANNFKFN